MPQDGPQNRKKDESAIKFEGTHTGAHFEPTTPGPDKGHDATAHTLAQQEKAASDDQRSEQSDSQSANSPNTANETAERIARAESAGEPNSAGYTPPSSNSSKPSLGQRVKALSTQRKAVFGIGTAIIIAIIIAIGAISPFGIFIHAQEVLSGWNLNDKAYARNMGSLYQKRYFTDPASCKGAKVLCRLTPGISDKEFAALEKAGFNPKRDATGKYILSFNVADENGKMIKIDGSNFKAQLETNPNVRAALDRMVPTRSSFMRNKFTVGGVFDRYRVNRSNPLGDSNDEKKMNQNFRKAVSGDNTVDPDTGRPVAGDDDSQADIDKANKQTDGLIAAAQDAADEITEARGPDLNNPTPTASVPDAGVLDNTDKAVQIATSSARGGFKGFFFGWFNSLDSVCSFKQAVTATSVLAKILKHREAIVYAATIVVAAEKIKVGDEALKTQTASAGTNLFGGTASAAASLTLSQADFLGNLMTTPSKKAESRGLTFADSAGWTLATQGKVKNRAGLARFTTGSFYMQSLDKFNSFLALKGIGTNTCRQVKSWYGQSALLIGGIITSILTFGTGAIKGTAEGLAVGAAIGTVWVFVLPQLAQMLAKVSMPDPFNDPEGSYGLATALVLGIGATNAAVGRINGLRPLKKSEYKKLLAESAADTRIAKQAEAINNPVKWYSTDSPDSLVSKLAMAVMPMSAKIKNADVGGALNQLSSLPSLGLATLSTPAHAAEKIDTFRDDLCIDPEYKALNVATTAGCTILTGGTPSEQDRDPTLVTQYMIDNDYVDSETDEAKGEYKDFLAICIEGQEPLSPDTDTKDCMRTDDKYINFYRYRQIQTGTAAIDSAVAGKLGIDSTASGGGAGATPTPTDPTTETPSAAGLQWPVALDRWPKPPVSAACYLGYKNISGDHTGMDISLPNGTPILAAADGTVSMESASYGAINIQHGPKLFTNYQHMSQIIAHKGKVVKRGDVIGMSGDKGAPGAFHLHFGVWFTNRFVSADDSDVKTVTGDPLKYLPTDRDTSPCKPI